MSAVAPVRSIQSFVSHRLFYLNVYGHHGLQSEQLFRNNVGMYHNIFVYAYSFLLPHYSNTICKGTSAACTNALSIIIVIGKGNIRRGYIRRKRHEIWLHQFQTYEVPWEDFIEALREEMKKQVGADIIDTVVCNLEDGFEVYTYVQGI